MKPLPLLIFFFISGLHAQYFKYSASVDLQGISSSKEQSPFWMHSNQRGRIDERTTMAGWANMAARYSVNADFYLESGIGGVYQNGYADKFYLDEYYVRFERSRITAFIGRRQREDLYGGLSASNKNILWSLNARPLPGVGFEIIEPIMLWHRGGLGLKASWEEYLTDDDRYVDNLRVHHKSFHIVFNKIKNVELIFGIQHFAQWAGFSPDYGPLPQTFRDYLDILVGKEGQDDVQGEEANALGNHLGSYEIYLNTTLSHFDIQLIYNTIFEDNSGRVLGNTPDGRYGLYIAKEDNDRRKWINALIYEFYYTRDQSKNTPTDDGQDNYFNNHLYKSGWTYENRILGSPFFILDEERFRVKHNTLRIHHLGLSGDALYRFPYKFLISYRENYGVKGGTKEPQERIVSSYLDLLIWEKHFNVNLQVGVDFSFEEDSNASAGIRVSKKFF